MVGIGTEIKNRIRINGIEYSAEEIAYFLEMVRRDPLFLRECDPLIDAAAHEIQSGKESQMINLFKKIWPYDKKDIIYFLGIHKRLQKKVGEVAKTEQKIIIEGILTLDGKNFFPSEIRTVLQILLAVPLPWIYLMENLSNEIWGNRPRGERYEKRDAKTAIKDQKMFALGMKIIKTFDPCSDETAIEFLWDGGPLGWYSDDKKGMTRERQFREVREALRRDQVLYQEDWWVAHGMEMPSVWI